MGNISNQNQNQIKKDENQFDRDESSPKDDRHPLLLAHPVQQTNQAQNQVAQGAKRHNFRLSSRQKEFWMSNKHLAVGGAGSALLNDSVDQM